MSETLSQAQAHSESQAPIWERKGMTQEDYLVSKAEQARRIGGKLVELAKSPDSQVRYEDREKTPNFIHPVQSNSHPGEYSGMGVIKKTGNKGDFIYTEIDVSNEGGRISKEFGKSKVEVSLGRDFPALTSAEMYSPDGHSKYGPLHPDLVVTPLSVEDTVSATANILNSARNDIREYGDAVKQLNAPHRARDIAKM